MKNIALQIVVVFALVFAGSNAYADGKEKSGEKNSSKDKRSGLFDKVSNHFDSELTLEEWMTELPSFEKSESNETLNDKSLELEEWMIDVVDFNSESFEEEVLDIENWMTESFEVASVEKNLEFENWMLQPFTSDSEENFQDEELVLEDWMLKF